MNARFVCTKCHKEYDITTTHNQCSCGGLFKLLEELPEFSDELIDKTAFNIFRYRRFMALKDDTFRKVTLGEGFTPIINFDESLMLKMDYFMPTLSFKDRGAAVLISHLKSCGVRKVVQDSSGNAGNSVAAYCGRAGIECEIYVPESTSPKKIAMIKAHGAKVHVIEGSRDHCAEVCRKRVAEEGLCYANHVYNPFFYEGTKTYIYEVYEQLGRIPKNIFVPLGNGTLFLGVIFALEHLLASGCISEMPNVIAVQSERCAPFAKALEKKSPSPCAVEVLDTLAEGIAIGVPMRGEEILRKIYEHHVKIVEIPEESILPARETLARKGIYCEHTTAGNYAAYKRYCEIYGRTEDCLITMCGAGLKSDH